MVGSKTKILVIIVSILFWAGCSSQNLDESASIVDYLTAFDFESGDQGWEGGIADFPTDFSAEFPDRSEMYAVNNDIIPNSLSAKSKGLNITADNPHGDLFYFFKRKITGLEPLKRYKLDFEFLVYTKLQDQIDGEIYLKIGATNYEPELEFQAFGSDTNYLMLNVDKGDANDESGADVINLGSVKEFSGDTPEVISGNSFDFPIEVVSDKNGEIWLIIGVDSGVKSPLTFGMSALTVYYKIQV